MDYMEKDSTERAERQEICPESVQAFVDNCEPQ